MNVRVRPERLEPEDLLRLPNGDHCELIDGSPMEKPMGAESDEIALGLGAILVRYCRASQLGHVYGPQTGYQCFPTRPRQVRLPDISFVASGRLPDEKSPKGYITIPPDLVVEVVSPNDTYEDVQARVMDFKAVNVRLIWVISPETRTVLVRRADGTCDELGESGELSGGNVIPGFTCKVAELFV